MNNNPQFQENPNLKNIAVLTLLFIFIFLCLTGGTVTILYRDEVSSYYLNLKIRGPESIDRQQEVIFNYFNTVLPDLLFCSNQNELITLLGNDDRKWAELAEQEYIEFARATKLYDQIRYIDLNGRERIKIIFNDDNVEAVKNDDLQDVSESDYFTSSITLNRGEIFVSKLDLNTEYGEIEFPYKPVIRLATPVFDDSGKKKGIVVLNCRAKKLLDDINYYADSELGLLMLCDSDGYWLLSPDFDANWGFMLGERKDRNFKMSYPEEWQTIENSRNSQFETQNGFFSFSKIFPLLETWNSPGNVTGSYIKHIKIPDPSKYYWVVITQIPSEAIQITKDRIGKKYLYILGISLIILIPGAYILAIAITRRREYRARLLSMALHDTLTGLPNRRYFMDRLKESIEHARRFNRKMGLLYIDLDGFKEVNDIKGHDTGDELLVEIAEILRKTTRTADIAARLGGDEFAIILFEIDSVEGAFNAGMHSVSNIDIPLQLKGGTIKVAASIGVAVFPDHASTPDELITQADRAMYFSKMHGKNRCTLARTKE